MKTALLRFSSSLALFAALAGELQAKTFIIPHVLEREGSIANTQFTFDTTLYVTYNGSVHGGDMKSADIEVYLYDQQTGLPMRGNTGNVCAPCAYKLDSKNRSLTISFEELINQNGGGFDQPVKLGFAVVVVNGSGADAVSLQGFVVNSHTGPFDLSVFGFDPQPIAAEAARTVVIPHVLETSGRASSETYSFDTVLHAVYAGGLPGTTPGGAGAELQVFLYDQTGAPMESGAGTAVCNPCTIPVGGAAGAPRKQTIVLDDLIVAAGGFGGSSVRQGFAVVTVAGADPANVALQGFVVNSHTSAFDLSVFGFEPQPIAAGASARTFVLPHILEKSGRSSDTQFTFDTTVFATYTPGLGGLPQGSGATVNLYLYDNAGGAMLGKNGTAVCAPCVFPIGPGTDGSPRKQSIRMDDLIDAAGGFDTAVKLGYGVIVVGGDDPAGVNLQGFVVNAHTSPFDLSVFGFQPEEVRSPAARTFVLPHVLEKEGLTASTPFSFDTTIFATYTGGLPGGTPSASAALKLYLFDSNTGLPLAGNTGEVCNPCAFQLSSANRKLTTNVEDLIVTRGGGFGGQTTRTAFGLLTIEGDAANVNLQAFVVNAHTSAFDLSVFGFEPQPLPAAVAMPMDIGISNAGGRPSLVVPTVVGGEYVVEARENLSEGDWAAAHSFTGDGTVKTVPLPPSAAQQLFYRVMAH